MAVSMNPRPVVYSDSATLKGRHFTVESLIIQTGSGKTFTLPTPTKDLAGRPTYFCNDGSGNLTLSGAFVAGSSYVIATKLTSAIVCLPTRSGTYKWHSGGIGSSLALGPSSWGTSYVAWTAYTPTLVFTTADPGSITKIGRYSRVADICTFNVEFSSADGNDGVPVSISLPLTSSNIAADRPLSSIQLVNTTYSNPLAYIASGAATVLNFRAASTCTNAVACKISVTGEFEVATP